MAVQSRSDNGLGGLKALVGVLGVLVILGTALVIGVVIHRLYGKAPAQTPGTIADLSPVPAPVSSLLGRGERISGIAAAGGDLAIWVSAPAGDRILLLDPQTGKIAVALSTAP